MTDFDPYKVLDLTSDCTDDDIKRSYKQKSRQYHPDRNGDKYAQLFDQCTKAKDLLVNRQQRELYDAGGWELVERHKTMSNMRNDATHKCPPHHIKVKVTLGQVYRGEKIGISEKIPILNEKGIKCGFSEFNFDLEVRPNMINNNIGIQCRGIERPEYVTGDVVIHLMMDDDKFDVSGQDLIYKVSLPLGDMFDYVCYIEHPDGKIYKLSGKCDNFDDHGNSILYYPDMGLKDDNGHLGLMIVVIEPDLESITKLSDKQEESIKQIVGRKYIKNDALETDSIDLKGKSTTKEELDRQRMESSCVTQCPIS